MELIRRFQPLEADGNFQMVDVAWKSPTARRAVAQGVIELQPDSYAALCEGRNPKGDVLKLAEIAGIQSAKRTSDLLPLCHPLALEKVRVWFQLNDARRSVTAYCEAATTAKTGVEMEALSGVNGALLAIYDLSKAVNPVISISGIHLELKEGGKSGVWKHPRAVESAARNPGEETELEGIRAAYLTISDRCSWGETVDRSGPSIKDYLEGRGAQMIASAIVPDEVDKIRQHVLRFIREEGAQLVITTGGTGLGPRDRTPEALEPLWSKRIPGLGELLRTKGAQSTPYSWLSRTEAGLVDRALIILLPGSHKAVIEGLDTIRRLLPHALEIAEGGSH